MKKVIGCLMMVSICTSTLLAERVHIEGYMKDSSFEAGDSWLDSGKRRHFVSAKSFGEISLYSEFFSFKGTTESDLYLSFFDSNFNGTVITKEVWKSSHNSSSGFKWHATCDITGGSIICSMWFKGIGDYQGKIMELSFNEIDVNTPNRRNPNLDDPERSNNIFALEGFMIDEPKD